MHLYSRHLALIFLALTAICCEREDTTYPSPKQTPEETKDTTTIVSPDPYEGSNDSTDENVLRIAKTLCGEWHGEMDMRYFDDYGVLNHHECEAQFTFTQEKDGMTNGKGKEIDIENGKTVWNVAFSWYVGNDEQIHLRYIDKTERYIATYHLDNEKFTGQMKTRDGWEECNFSLSRYK